MPTQRRDEPLGAAIAAAIHRHTADTQGADSPRAAGESLRSVIESTLAKAGGQLGECALAKAAAEASGAEAGLALREIRQMVTYGQLWARAKGGGRTIYALGTPRGSITHAKGEETSSLAMDGPGSMDTVGQREARRARRAGVIQAAIKQTLGDHGHMGQWGLITAVGKRLGVDPISVGMELTDMLEAGELRRKKAGKGYTVWPSRQPEPKRKNWGQLQAEAESSSRAASMEAHGLPQGGAVAPAPISTPPEPERGKDGQGETTCATPSPGHECGLPPCSEWDGDTSEGLKLTAVEMLKVGVYRAIEQYGQVSTTAADPELAIEMPPDASLLYRVGVAVGLLDGSLYREEATS